MSSQIHHAACPVCSGSRLYYLFSVGHDRVVRCEDCGLLVAQGHTANGGAIPAVPPDATGTMRRLAAYRSSSAGHLWCHASVGESFVMEARSVGFVVTSGGEIPGDATRCFDVVLAGDWLNHTAEPEHTLAAIHRALRPDGTLVAWTPPLSRWRGDAPNRRTDHATATAGRFYFNATTLESVLFRGSFRHLAVFSPNENDYGRATADEGCIVLGQPEPARPRPLLSVIVAIYNEAATAVSALDRLTAKRIPGFDLEVIIVESNSTDGTREIVRRYATQPGVRVIHEDGPRGKGRAVREGLQHATGDFVLIQDADLEYDLEDYELLLEPLASGRTAFVLGARHGGQTWKIRRFNDQPAQAMLLNFAHRGFTALINVSLGLRLSDPFTMYKVFRRDCLHGLTFECNRFDFDWELLIKLVRKGYRPIEIPVNYRSRSFKEGKKVRMIRDPLTWIWAWARARFGPLER